MAILWYVLGFAVLLGMNIAAPRSEQLAVGLLFGFGLLLGLAVAPTVGYYAGADPRRARLVACAITFSTDTRGRALVRV